MGGGWYGCAYGAVPFPSARAVVPIASGVALPLSREEQADWYGREQQALSSLVDPELVPHGWRLEA